MLVNYSICFKNVSIKANQNFAFLQCGDLLVSDPHEVFFISCALLFQNRGGKEFFEDNVLLWTVTLISVDSHWWGWFFLCLSSLYLLKRHTIHQEECSLPWWGPCRQDTWALCGGDGTRNIELIAGVKHEAKEGFTVFDTQAHIARLLSGIARRPLSAIERLMSGIAPRQTELPSDLVPESGDLPRCHVSLNCQF